MTLQNFIAQNREWLDKEIARRLRMDHNPRPTDRERRLWVLNDEVLYLQARAAGVKI